MMYTITDFVCLCDNKNSAVCGLAHMKWEIIQLKFLLDIFNHNWMSLNFIVFCGVKYALHLHSHNILYQGL